MDYSLGNEEKKNSKPIKIPTSPSYPNSRLKNNIFFPNNSPNTFLRRVEKRLKAWESNTQ